MFCTSNTPEQRRWVRACWMGALLVTPLVLGAVAAFRFWHLKGVPAYLVAVLPTLPILWVLVEMGRFLAVEKDEFQRNILVQCVLGGRAELWPPRRSGVTWRTLPTRRVYPIFWLFVVASYPVVRLRYR